MRIRFGFMAVVIAILLPLEVNAEQPVYNFGFPIVSRDQATGLKPGAKIAMACSKCRSVQLCEVEPRRGVVGLFNPKVKHVCPGCGGYWHYVSYGRERWHPPWVHTCSKCGSKSMFCCSTEPGKRTIGM